MYFPDFEGGDIECSKCEKANCMSRGKHQRNRKDFEVTSGRCPRLPDWRGFVDMTERENQRNAYPIVHAEMGGEAITLSISRPGVKRMKKVYRTKSGYWYFRDKAEWSDGTKSFYRQAIAIGWYKSEDRIMEYMEDVRADYCLLPCEILGFTV